MRTHIYIVLAAFLAFPLLTRAEDTVVSDNIEATMDSIVVAEDSVPEWYVPAEIPAELRAPMRANAGTCLTDSILTFNSDSVLTETTIYEYDAANRAIRTIVWKYDVTGILSTSSKQEYAYDASGTQIYTGTFAWDANTNDWKGTAKSEFVYNEAHKMESNITYTWVNNTWLPSQALTYAYDAAGRETEFTTYSRNASANRLVPSKQRLQTWYNASKKTLEINYTAYSNGAWSAGNKKVYAYDAAGNQTEYTYYSSYTNGDWVGSTQEFWTYNAAKKKTLYEKYTWKSGAWAGSSKEIWEFNASNKQTLHEKFKWANNDWDTTLREMSGYDSDGNNILIENYNIKSGVLTGTKKEVYIYTNKKKTDTYKYMWSNGEWIYNTWDYSGYDPAGNTIETAKYSWTNNAWNGVGSRVLKTYNSSKKVVEQINQSWSATTNDWVNVTRTTTDYAGGKTIQEASYTWSENIWTPATRTDYHYSSTGVSDTTTTYSTDGISWVYLNRTINRYNAAGSNIMTHNSTWNGTAWILVSMTRTDEIKDAAGRQLLYATWYCESDSIWKGISKDTAAYNAYGQKLYSASYSSWQNNDWVPSTKYEYAYNDQNLKIFEKRMSWENGAWIGYYWNEWEFDANGRQIMNTNYLWIGDEWLGVSHSTTTYAPDGKKATEITYSYLNGIWEPTFQYTFTYDTQGRNIEEIVWRYTDGQWVEDSKYVHGFNSRGVEVVTNQYGWSGTAWTPVSVNEKFYDVSDNKLRRDKNGSWYNGSLLSYTDKHYFYSCDAPASNGSQPRTPTDIEEIDENNGTYENNVQPFDPTQPTYNLSGQRVDPASYHGIVIQSGHTYYLP